MYISLIEIKEQLFYRNALMLSILFVYTTPFDCLHVYMTLNTSF